MPELLLELFCEEIPARMQTQAAADLRRLVTDALVERGLLYEGAVAHATPRRLALHVAGLPARQPDRNEEKKGPRVSAPQPAIDGFLRSAGFASLDEATIVEDKKGPFYVAKITRPGAATLDVLAEILPAILKSFPWPKSMRWGAASVRSDSLRWVRPLHSILATFGPETEEPEIVPFAVDGIAAGNVTQGHRFMAPGEIRVRRFDDYAPALERAKVVLDAGRRRDIILHDAKDLSFAQGLEMIEDEKLLEEVAGLVEWPRVLMGRFDPAFLAIPPEVIRATIRVNQKCFVLREAHPSRRAFGAPQDEESSTVPHGEEARSAVSNHEAAPAPHPTALPASGESGSALAPRFILVANIEARDGGAAIVAGNERVVAARLSDAKFFWQGDLKVPLEERVKKLDKIVFHEKLGTQGERVQRIAALARQLAPLVGADPAKAFRAAMLCKADLVSEMVGEFPELQGLMGRYYAQHQGEDASVATAIEDHYRPQGPSDRVPSDPVAIAVALADKIDTLVGFWAIDEKPTGSKDPYALRRAALGVIRILLERSLRLSLLPLFDRLGDVAQQAALNAARRMQDEAAKAANVPMGARMFAAATLRRRVGNAIFSDTAIDLLAFFADRLKVYLRDKGARHDLIDAAMGANPSPARGRGWPDEVGSGEGSQISGGLEVRETSPHPSGSAGHLLPQAGEGGANDDLPPIDAEMGTTPAAPSPLVGEGTGGGTTTHARDDAPTPNPSPQGGGGQAAGAANDDLLLIVRRVEALAKLLDSDDGKNLLAGYKRAANILRAEEKKDGVGAFDAAPDATLFVQDEERALKSALDHAECDVAIALSRENFAAAMAALATLRAPVDAFFEKVTVNADDPALRQNRLRLLNALRGAMHAIADFSKITG